MMSDIPESVSKSILWNIVSQNSQLLQAIKDVRKISEVISEKISQSMPGYTDHSIKHTDALWGISEITFTEEELRKFSIGEAFILGCSFYVHDLGMAYCVTEEGRRKTEETAEYRAIYSHLRNGIISDDEARIKSVQVVVRRVHAEKAIELTSDILPGTGRYLIEDSDLRQKWNEHIGLVSSSHNWSLNELDLRIGKRGMIPVAIGESDLGFIACALRLIDYAHINYERASIIDRLLRGRLGKENVINWTAQENIAGPSREGDLLKYASLRSVDDVDGWWKFYELASGLSREIATVYEYLESRSCSKGRFSLSGIKGTESPEEFAQYIQTEGFEPIDIRFRADSIERLVNLLGGKQLYGNDYSAPLRELLQNAGDAIKLYRIQNEDVQYGEINVEISNDNSLTVRDNGVGMSKNTVTKYLLSIASDYWNSEDFIAEYPEVSIKGFSPAGRYGVGFLSVFMIGDKVEVETEKTGSSRLKLHIEGLGQRGYLETKTSTGINGTTVRVKISKEMVKEYKILSDIIREKAPMLSIPIKTKQGDGKEKEIRPKWWQSISQDRLTKFLVEPISIHERGNRTRRIFEREIDFLEYRYLGNNMALNKIDDLKKWPGKQPELIEDEYRIIAVPQGSRMIICSRGFTVKSIEIRGMMGLVDIGDVKLNTSRSSTIEWNSEEFKAQMLDKLRPKIISALDGLLDKETNIPARFSFLAEVGKSYGYEIFTLTKLKWISVIKPPGDILLLSAEDLRRVISKEKEIFITYNVNPWNSHSICTEYFGNINDTAIIIPISSVGQADVGSYSEEKEIVECPLPEHFLSSKYENITNAPILLATLKIISENWKISQEDLYQNKWRRVRGVLCGYIKRNEQKE